MNPNAPKGGYITYGNKGTFDNFNRYADRGTSAPSILQIFDSLLTSNSDEDNVYYGHIAEKMEYPKSLEWINFHLNPKAKFPDGAPILAKDIEYSFQKFMKEGIPQLIKVYDGVTVEVVGERKVKFNTPMKDKYMFLRLGGLSILPQQFWKDHKLSEPLQSIPMGSGGWKVHEFSMGEYVIYQRDPNYWAADHPTQKGLYNIEFERYDVYKDDTVLFEAFKKGEYDFRTENIAKQWKNGYVGKNFDAGFIEKEELIFELPTGMSGFVFNTTREFLKDRNVRQAIGYMFDFEWSNKNLFYDSYKRNTSYFQYTQYKATGLPEGEELKILNKYKADLPKEVFSTEITIPKTKGNGKVRAQMRSALKLLKAAGWKLKDGKLVNAEGKQMVLEIMMWSNTLEKVVIPFKENLARVGIQLDIRTVDLPTANNRLRERDYDLIFQGFGGGVHPQVGLLDEFHSDYLDSTYTNAGFTSKATDEIIMGIVDNQENLEVLEPLGKALDRILMWNHLLVPGWHSDKTRISYWKKFARPEKLPKYGLDVNAWWYDAEAAKKLPKRNAPN